MSIFSHNLIVSAVQTNLWLNSASNLYQVYACKVLYIEYLLLSVFRGVLHALQWCTFPHISITFSIFCCGSIGGCYFNYFSRWRFLCFRSNKKCIISTCCSLFIETLMEINVIFYGINIKINGCQLPVKSLNKTLDKYSTYQ